MSILKLGRKKKGEPAKWVLKAKLQGSSEWEEIETYEEPKSYSDLKDVIDELKNEGYEAVRLDAYDKDGKFVKRIFVRYFSSTKTMNIYQQMQKTMMEMMNAQVEMMSKFAEMMTKLPSGMSYEDAIAQVLYLKQLEKTLAEAMGLSPNQIQNPEFMSFLMDILKELIKKYMPEIEQKIAEKFGAKKPSAPTPTPIPMPTPIPAPAPMPKVEVPEDIKKVIEDAKQKVFEQTLPPCVKEGICKEGE